MDQALRQAQAHAGLLMLSTGILTSRSDPAVQALSSLSYRELLQHREKSFKQAGNTRADVLLLNVDGTRAILKDYTQSSKWFSRLLSPWLVYRETRALRLLQDVAGTPRLIGKVSSRAFLMEYIPARRIRFVGHELDWDDFIGRTENLVAMLHETGVVHGDLRNATNILVDQNRQPVFVDFVSAAFRGYRYNPFTWALFNLCLCIDQGAMFKLKNKYAPQMVSAEELASNSDVGFLERVARWFSVRIRNLVQGIFP
jgi:serine/threonine protein kinase